MSSILEETPEQYQKRMAKSMNLIVPEPPILPFEEWEFALHEKYQKLKNTIHEKMPDAWEPLEFTLSVLMILNIKDNSLPFAGIILGNPSSSKTVGIELLRTCSRVYYSDSFTPKSFVSHNTSVKKDDLKKIDLLPRIKNKTFLAPELSPIFTKKDDDLIELIGILTRVLDGKGFVSDSGSHGQRGYPEDIMFTMVGASVDIPYRVYKILGSIGPKLYFLRLPKKNKKEDEYISQLKSKTFNSDFAEIQRLVSDYLQWFDRCPVGELDKEKMLCMIEWSEGRENKDVLLKIVKLGKLLSSLRGIVATRETYNTDGINYAYTIANKEEPDRAMRELYNLARGHALSQGRNYITDDDYGLLVKVTLSTASRERVEVFKLLIENDGKLSTTDVEDGLNTSANTAKRTMAEFKALGLVTLDKVTKQVGNLDVEIWYATLMDEFKEFTDPKFTALSR